MAVLLVLAFHAGLPLPNGFLGVDVFFVISGFLITGLLLRELADIGRIAWGRFVARRVRRLLPAAVLVLVVTAAAAWVVVPGLRRHDIGTDVAGAAVYVVNWVLAHRAVDYLASDALPSPVQHYWSLSVEEQFYVVWPLALLALVWVLRRFGRRPTVGWVGALLAVLAVPSFGYAVWLGAVDPARAYFVTTARAWELGIGAALAVVCHARADASTSPRVDAVRSVVGWLGLAAVALAALWLPEGATTPGPWTLVPTMGAAAVLYAGWAGARRGPARVLGAAPMVWIGGLSYSIYLWHWPVVVLADWAPGGVTPLGRVALTVASVLPAWASHRFLEAPVHHSRALASRVRPALAVGAALSVVGLIASVPLTQASSPIRTAPQAGPRPPVDTLGAERLDAAVSRGQAREAEHEDDWVVPDPQRAGTDRPRADVDHCQVDRRSTEPVRCDFGVPDGATTIALVGDSKAMQWLPALEALAEERSWRVVTWGKSSCAFGAGRAALAGAAYPQCDEWNRRVMAHLAEDPPDVVLTSGHATSGWNGSAPSRTTLVDGLVTRWQEVRDLGSRVVVLADSPSSPDDLDVCTARHPRQLDRCAFDRADAVATSGLPAQQEAARRAGVPLVDLNDWICPGSRCPVAIGHVTVHRPGDHLTATYVRTLAPVLGRALGPHLGEQAALR